MAKLLDDTLSSIAGGKRLTVLDLGPARASTVAYFNGSRCRLGIANLPAGLAALNAAGDKPGKQQLLRELVPAELFAATDLVLAWDLLDYMDKATIAVFMNQLLACLRPGALVHAMVAYSASMLPEPPPPMELHVTAPAAGVAAQGRGGGQTVAAPGVGIMRCESVVNGSRPAPRYPTGILLDLMPGFRVERSTLLRNGVQEYLFKC